jgi:hypothetical protein
MERANRDSSEADAGGYVTFTVVVLAPTLHRAVIENRTGVVGADAEIDERGVRGRLPNDLGITVQKVAPAREPRILSSHPTAQERRVADAAKGYFWGNGVPRCFFTTSPTQCFAVR